MRWDGWREGSRSEATRAASGGKVEVEGGDCGHEGAGLSPAECRAGRLLSRILGVKHCLRGCLQAGKAGYRRQRH